MTCPDLPEGHAVVRSPAKDEPQHQHSGQLDSLEPGSANHSLAADSSTKYLRLGPPVYQDDDGHVAPQHQHQGQEEGHGQHKKEVEKLLNVKDLNLHLYDNPRLTTFADGKLPIGVHCR